MVAEGALHAAPAHRPSTADVWALLSSIPDPEIPAISIVDLGIVRGLTWDETGLIVSVTPTYSGCPATEVISQSITDTLEQNGIAGVRVKMQLSPAWTTDWLSPEAKEKLRGYGIAPPAEQVIDISRITRRRHALPAIACPRCGSTHTEQLSEFGSTPCKSLFRCKDCREPFDYFKCH